MFQHGDNWEWIWLLAAVAIAAIATEIWRRRVLRRFVGEEAAESMRGQSLKNVVIVAAELLAMFLLVAGLADPRWGFRVEQIPEPKMQLVFAVDVSRSMSAEDAPPSRLERAKTLVTQLLTELGGERVALVAFAGNARTIAPLTRNYAEISAQLAALQVSDRLIGGSELTAAFQEGCDAFLHRLRGEKLLVVLTDGEDHGATEPAQIAAIAAECGCRTLIVGLGDPVAGSRIPVAQTPTGPQYVMYKGETVVTRMNDKLLETLASLTHGVYLPANSNGFDLAAAYRERLVPNIEDVHRMRRMRVGAARFPWFLTAALLVLLCQHALQRERRVGLSSGSRPHSPSRPSTAAHLLAAMAVLAIGIGASTDDLVRKANRNFRAGRLDEAFAGYQEAATVNGQSALPLYNQAVVYYRAGERAAARGKLSEALATDDETFSSRSHFLLGNCDYVDVVAGDLSKKDAIARLRSGIGHYRRALMAEPGWADPRVNIELAQMLVEQIERAPELPQGSNKPGDEKKKGGGEDNRSASHQAGQNDASGRSERNGSSPPRQSDKGANGESSSPQANGGPQSGRAGQLQRPANGASTTTGSGPAGGGTPHTGGPGGTQESGSSGNTGDPQNSPSAGGRNPNAKTTADPALNRDDVQQRLDQILQKSRKRQAERKSGDGRQPVRVDKDW